jgi:hypothetical protein
MVHYSLLRRTTRVRTWYLQYFCLYHSMINTCLQISKMQEISCFPTLFFITARPLNRHGIRGIPLLRRVISVAVAIRAIPGSAPSLHRK